MAHFFKRGTEKNFIHEGVGRVIGTNKKWGTGIMAFRRHYHPSKGQGRDEVQSQVRTGAEEKPKPLSDRPGRVRARRMNSSVPVSSCPPIHCWCLFLAQWEIKGQEGRGRLDLSIGVSRPCFISRG